MGHYLGLFCLYVEDCHYHNSSQIFVSSSITDELKKDWGGSLRNRRMEEGSYSREAKMMRRQGARICVGVKEGVS